MFFFFLKICGNCDWDKIPRALFLKKFKMTNICKLEQQSRKHGWRLSAHLLINYNKKNVVCFFFFLVLEIMNPKLIHVIYGFIKNQGDEWFCFLRSDGTWIKSMESESMSSSGFKLIWTLSETKNIWQRYSVQYSQICTGNGKWMYKSEKHD